MEDFETLKAEKIVLYEKEIVFFMGKIRAHLGIH